MTAFGQEDAVGFLTGWLTGRQNLVLVTGRASYAVCGAETFFTPLLAGRTVSHFTTAGENARAEDVAAMRARMPTGVDGFVAVGGGTVIDTAKLLRGGFPETPESEPLPPFLAVPTTAGTGAEATRFAVYYDRGEKKSADHLRYRPTDQLLMPAFTQTQNAYQRACTEFDAYAQAVESLWARGATDESRAFARKALDLMAHGEQMLGSYWAGRAIDISRTTAAHALSYYLTVRYGVPHGHAVYMMFPYVCRANGHPEYVRAMPELATLDAFAAARGLDRSALVDQLLEHVNPQRLANNPAPISKETFNA